MAQVRSSAGAPYFSRGSWTYSAAKKRSRLKWASALELPLPDQPKSSDFPLASHYNLPTLPALPRRKESAADSRPHVLSLHISRRVIGFALIISAFLIQRARPKVEIDQPSADLVRATGKCAECHARTQYSVVHEYEMSAHAKKGVNCLDCHQPAANQEKKDHHGFVIPPSSPPATAAAVTKTSTSNSSTAVMPRPPGPPSTAKRASRPSRSPSRKVISPAALAVPRILSSQLEGDSAMNSGCDQCHSVGKPNADGTIGTCTACHTRHTTSVRIARLPSTCAQCHMGPDHSQIEIYDESKHGVMFQAQERLLNLDAPPETLTTRDMFVPTCATCHMSGINGLGVTHDPSERLSYYLANAITESRPNYAAAQAKMKHVCTQCHTPSIHRSCLHAGRAGGPIHQRPREHRAGHRHRAAQGRRALRPALLQPIDFVYFDLWHYDGRTTKHGAFMGGADFVQWHGNYPMLQKTVQLKEMAAQLRREHGKSK